MDDLTIAEAEDLKTKLKLYEENTLVKPLTYHERIVKGLNTCYHLRIVKFKSNLKK